MEITGINSTTQTNRPNGTDTLNQLGEDYTTFLNLLTAQISNQDPLEPIDSTTFVTQLAQLSQVEQAAQTNINLENLAAKFDSMNLTTSSALIGQNVSFPTDTIVLSEAGAQASYQVAPGATKATADIYNPSGLLIRSISGLPSQSGVEHSMSWDGTSDLGQPALLGNYRIVLRATNDLENQVDAEVYRSAEIKEAQLSEGQIFYKVDGGQYISPESIRSLK